MFEASHWKTQVGDYLNSKLVVVYIYNLTGFCDKIFCGGSAGVGPYGQTR